MDEKEQIVSQLRALNKRLYAINQKEASARNRALLGKCYKYRNNYSVPEKASDYWWLYIRVDKVKGAFATTFEFQTDKHGEMSVRPSRINVARFDHGHIEIKPSEFARALASLQKRIAKL